VIRVPRALYKRMGVLHLGRRRVQDFFDFIRDRQIDLVIDVGANTGQFGESLRADGYRGRIVSFEPVRAAFEVLSQKAAKDGNWEVHRCGLGAATGAASLHVSKLSVFSSILDLAGAARLHDDRMAVEHVEEISIRPLDDVAAGLTGRILLKIDTQGYEKQVLEGGRRTLSRSQGVMLELPVIRVYDGAWRFHEAVHFMFKLGFVPAQIQPVGYHGKDKVSAVEFDCLFRPMSELDGATTATSDEPGYAAAQTQRT
jgi:FkbM family methyltransferase